MRNALLVYFLVITFALSCQKVDEIVTSQVDQIGNAAWLIDTSKMNGTKPTNSFPLVTDPVYLLAKDFSYHILSEKVTVFKIDETVFIYPHWLLGVEVVNDKLNDTYFAITYCPKTLTSYVIDRKVDQVVSTFRASGLLYQDNLVYMDMETSSLWSQMLYKCIHGNYLSQSPKYINSFEMKFGEAKNFFPDAKVFVDYNADISSKVSENRKKTNPQSGNLVLGLLDHSSKPDVLSAVDYTQLDQKGLIISRNHLVVFSKKYGYINAFFAIPSLTYDFIDDFPNILSDNEGNTWDAFGIAVDGPRKGEQLQGSISYLALWWAWQGIFESFEHLSS